MPRNVGPIDPSTPIAIDVTGLSDHVVAYTFWSRPPTTDSWTQFADGHTGDNVPDHFTLNAMSQSQVYFWVGVGNPRRPNSVYNALITVGQNGRRLPGGSILLTGKTDENGNDSIEDWYTLL